MSTGRYKDCGLGCLGDQAPGQGRAMIQNVFTLMNTVGSGRKLTVLNSLVPSYFFDMIELIVIIPTILNLGKMQ